MRSKIAIAVVGVLACVALAAGMVGPRQAEADRVSARAGDVVVDEGMVRAGDVVIDENGVRIEDGPSIDLEEEGDGATDRDSAGDEADDESQENAPVGEGEMLLKLRGDEGVGFSGTCSVGDEEKEIEGQVPEEFTFALEGDELECELSKEGEDGTLKVVLLSENSRSVQKVSGEGTMKFSFSDGGVSSSMSSASGSSSAVNQSSVVQSSSSSSVR